MISIICPVYNEEKALTERSENFRGLSRDAEVIFCDGGSSDAGVEIAGKLGKVLRSKKGRAYQMDYAAGFARGGILLFLHADCMVSADTLGSIEKAVKDGFIGGCLTQRIDNSAFIYRVIEAQGNFRAKLSREFYGDQGIFVRKDIFSGIGGFPEAPIMEDVLFSRKLRSLGKTVVLPDKIIVSARRWRARGVFRGILLYNLIIILFLLKVPLDRIKKLYEDIR